MRSKQGLIPSIAMLVVLSLTIIAPDAGAVAQESVLYSLGGSGDGANSFSTLIFDASGNLYGTAENAGPDGVGIVFELTRTAGGDWTEEILHAFTANGTDGYAPFPGLTFDAAGNLYGTTIEGGAYGSGTVFELKRTKAGWLERVIHSFSNNGKDGESPNAGVVFDPAGNLYGTTATGGVEDGGSVFELIPKGNGWAERVLHSFPGYGAYDSGPYTAGVILDSAGNLYGTTIFGGAYNFGTVFELSPKSGGDWTSKILHSFSNGTDGILPEAGLIFDSRGNLYGTTNQGTVSTGGTVFKLSPDASGGWTEKVLQYLDSSTGDFPGSSLIFDASGNLYGTTLEGGANNSGTVYKLAPGASGEWTDTVLHSFGSGTDGSLPWAGLIMDDHGNLYGTTIYGGVYGNGTVFEITP